MSSNKHLNAASQSYRSSSSKPFSDSSAANLSSADDKASRALLRHLRSDDRKEDSVEKAVERGKAVRSETAEEASARRLAEA